VLLFDHLSQQTCAILKLKWLLFWHWTWLLRVTSAVFGTATVNPCFARVTAPGLLGFPPKELQYRFLAGFTPVFYIRQRDYSKVCLRGCLYDRSRICWS
jgi:hypothetical protein